jgi:hypothetical protein
VSPFWRIADEVDLMALNESFGGIVSQQDAREVGSALLFDQQTCPQGQSSVAREQLVER